MLIISNEHDDNGNDEKLEHLQTFHRARAQTFTKALLCSSCCFAIRSAVMKIDWFLMLLVACAAYMFVHFYCIVGPAEEMYSRQKNNKKPSGDDNALLSRH